MAKTITFNYEGTDYTLEYTRKSIQTMERMGFNATEIEAKPMTIFPKLFAGAFLAHHPTIKQDKIDKIYSLLPNKETLIEKLAEMYNEPMEALMSEPTEGNLDWTPSW